MMNPQDETTQASQKLSRWIPELRNLLLITASVMAIVLALQLFHSLPSVHCVVPHSPAEMLLGIGGMILLTVIGVPLAPATVFGLAIWLVLKLSICTSVGG